MYKNYKILLNGEVINSVCCFIIVLVLMVILGFYSMSSIISDIKTDQETISTKIDLNCKKNKAGKNICNPDIYYQVDTKEYVCEKVGNFLKSELKDDIKIYYDSKRPTFCTTELNVINPLILNSLFIGIIIIMGIILNNLIESIKALVKFKNLCNIGTLYSENCKIELVKKVIGSYGLYRISVLYKVGDLKEVKILEKYMDINSNDIKKVDLLIDKNNTDNYIIDFNIN